MRALIRELIETVILALLIFLGLQFGVQNYRVEGSSMRSTLEQKQHVLVNKLVYLRFDPQDLAALLPFVDIDREELMYPFHRPRQGEVIVFHFPLDPSRDFVKRVIGIPGQIVEIREGKVSVDGVAILEPYVAHADRRSMGPIEVPPDSYFVLGDNRPGSNDSRDWGPVSIDQIIGRAWLSYWPLDRFHILRAFSSP